MNKPAWLKKTARFFPGKEFDADTATQITSEGRIADPPSYRPFKGKEYLFNCTLKKGLAPYISCIEILGRSARERKDSGCVVFGIREWHFNRLSYLFTDAHSHTAHMDVSAHIGSQKNQRRSIHNVPKYEIYPKLHFLKTYMHAIQQLKKKANEH